MAQLHVGTWQFGDKVAELRSDSVSNTARTGIAAAIILGTLATIVSGEYKISWEFLFVDIPLVAGSSLVSILALRQFRRRLPRQDITDR